MVIPKYEHYSVDECGNVWSHYSKWGKRKTPKRLADRPDGKGYLQVRLYTGAGQSEYLRVSRLVAQAFLDNPDGLPEVHHKDEDKLNNTVSNLEWVTGQQNVEATTSKHYVFLNPQGTKVKVFNLLKFCRKHGLTSANMYKVFYGERQTHKGWRRA